MATRTWLLLVVLIGTFAPTTGAQGQRVTITAASAFDGKGRTITNPTIIVANGRIADVTTTSRRSAVSSS